MSAAAELFVRVSADVKGLTRGMDEAAKAIDHIDEQAKAAKPAVSSLTSSMGGLGGIAIGATLVAAGAAMGAVGTQAVKLAGELEQNKVAFTTMLKSGEAADTMLRNLATFAASTPFELRGLTDSAKKLIAFGFKADSIIPIMTSLGDAIGGVGGGQEAIGQVTMALGQMAAKGKVSAEEMNQFAEKGINTWKYVAQAIGKSVPEAMKLAEKGAIDAATAIPAILEGMSKEFGGMMQKQSQTWNGALSNFQDSTDQALTKIGNALIKMGLSELLQTMTVGINNLAAAFDSGAIIPAIQATEAAVLGLATAFTAYLLPGARVAGASMVTAFQAGAVAAAPFLALGAAVAFAAYPIIKNWQEIKIGLQDVFNAGMQYMTQFYNWGAGIVRDLANNWQTGMSYIAGIIRSVLGNAIADKLIGGVRSAGTAFTGFAAKAAPAMQAVGDVGRWTAAQFKETWGDAFSSASKLTVGLFKETATVPPEIKKITAELLGLKKSGASVESLAAAHKKAESEARKHAAALERLHAAGARAYERFENMAMALGGVQAGLRQAEAEGLKLGRSFDLAGAKAAVIKEGLSKVESAFGKFSPQANALRELMEKLATASANGGKATAEAFKVLDGAALSLEQAQLKAQLLGDEFDANSAAVSQYGKAVGDLIEKGLKPGNAQLDEAIKRYNEAREAKRRAAEAAKTYAERLNEITSTGKAVYSALTDMAGVFGLKLPDAISKAVDGVFTLANGFGTLMTTGPKLLDAIMPALTTIAAAAMANPVVAIVAGITAAVGIGVYAWNEYQKSSTAAMQAAAAAAEQARQELEVNNQLALESSDLALRTQQAEFQAMIERSKAAFSSIKEAANQGFRDSLSAFISGASNYGEILREKIREGMAQAIIDNLVAKGITNKFDEYFTQIADNIDKGMGSANAALLTELEGKIIKQVEGLGDVGKKLFDAIGMVSPGAAAMAKQASDEAARLRAAHASTLNNIYKNLERSSPNSERLLAQARILQGRAQPGDEALARGMATGGLVTGPTYARMGEGGRNEAVLPLNENVYRQIGEGIAAARGGGSGVQLVVSYQGSGKWTREDAQGLGRLLVSELRSMGVRA